MTDALIVSGASEVVTCDESLGDGPVGKMTATSILIVGDRISWIGPNSELKANIPQGVSPIDIDVQGKSLVPGFIDAHTHLIFAGERRNEFAARAGGIPYSAGGILETVAATRAATDDQLFRNAMDRAWKMIRAGTTTAEAKSGYALEPEGELRLLKILGEVAKRHPIDLEITFLGAHAIPDEYVDSSDAYVDSVCEMLPEAASLSSWCDVFCDYGAFSPDQAWRVLEAGKSVGLVPRIHANELGPSGGADVAMTVGAASADHLLHLNRVEARGLAERGCVGVLCPTTALGIGRFPDYKMMREEGMTVALASDLNPGTAYAENLQFAIAIATRSMGLGPQEALLSVTANAAASLRRNDIGRIAVGCIADVLVLASDSHLDLGYRAGSNIVERVIKRGALVEA